jgi:hypothetical protein
MKTKNALLFTVIAFTQFCAAFGQSINNFQGVYPVQNWSLLTTNYTITKAYDNSGCVLVTNPGVTSDRGAKLLEIKFGSEFFNIQSYRCFAAIYNETKVGIETKDVITLKDSGYVACGNILYNNEKYAYIAKFAQKFTPIWGQ